MHARDAENVRRLAQVLRGLDAHYRSHPNRRVEPAERDLMLPGHHLLATRFGPLDVLGAVTGGQGYADLFERASAMDLGRGLVVQVVELDALVEMKEKLGRDKDRAQLPEYRRTLEERRARGD
ncbi:MAG: hypothetical protein IT453_17935 [Planctomycetes bacterium]|nr:hypothetical protein [Planctomycetota bacterium]